MSVPQGRQSGSFGDELTNAAMIGLASGAWDEARFADWLRPRIVVSRSGQLHAFR